MLEPNNPHERRSRNVGAVADMSPREPRSADPAPHSSGPAEEMSIEEEGTTAGQGVEAEQLGESSIEGPFDPAGIRISTKEPTVDLVVERIRREEIVLQPDFQRSDDVWSKPTQSRLVESLLLRIPIPVFYMAADRDDNWKVVDGLQRLSTLRDFILRKNLRLRGLEYLSQFHNYKFDDLPRPMQRRITETQLSCHVIEPGTPAEVMFNVFKRINTGGKPLVGQEIRHALNPGAARDLLRRLSRSEEFLRATDGTVSPKRMADRECVLRFLAFRSLGQAKYGGKLDDFLMLAMGFLDALPREIHVSLEADFRRAMSLAADIFGREAFRKPKRAGYSRQRTPVNKPLFESLSVALAEVPVEHTDALKSRKGKIVKNFTQMIKEDTEFFESITVGTQTTRQVMIRFARTREMLQEVLP